MQPVNSSTSPPDLTVSAIIVSYNSEKYIHQCLDALLQSGYRIKEVVVVDNASKDSSSSIVERFFPRVRLVRNSRNLGFAGGCNLGLGQVSGQVVAFVNPDVIVRPSWLGELMKVMAEDPSVAIVGGKLLYADHPTIQHAGGFLHYPLALADHYGYGQPDDGRWDELRDVEYVTGAALAVRRQVLDALSGFDERFSPAYFEETDLCWRARKAGFKVVYAPKAVGIHYETTSTGKDSYNYYYYYHLNRLRFVLKNYTRQQLLKDFFPAELNRLKLVCPEAEKRALDAAYREMLDYMRAGASTETDAAAVIHDGVLVKAMEQLSMRCNKLSNSEPRASTQNVVALGTDAARHVWRSVFRTGSRKL